MAKFIIGVDCSTDERKVGLALGSIVQGRLNIHEVVRGNRKQSVAELIGEWLLADQPTLLALDAPLGWPIPMGVELFDHSAGVSLKSERNYFFLRQTDRIIWDKIEKKPLEVGANYIARTAHAALKLLQTLREEKDMAIPLAWEPGVLAETCAIEVYPAATLSAYGISNKNYKSPKATTVRQQLIDRLSDHMDIAADRKQLELSPHLVDAVICVLAGYDFLSGQCLLPNNMETAHKEGWIWVKDPKKN